MNMNNLNLFKRKKTPEQLTKLLKEALDSPKPPAEVKSGEPPAVDEVTKRLNQIKVLLYGEVEQDSSIQKCMQMAELLIETSLLLRLLNQLETLPFEARKHVAQIFNNILRRDLAKFVSYVERHPNILKMLIHGYDSPEIALNCGSMLREAIRHESLAQIVLYSDDLMQFNKFAQFPNFEISSDAFATFKELLTRHKALCAQFFDSNFDVFFDQYNQLLQSENYVTRRQSLKLLGEIMLDRPNFNIMMRYISKKENLKMMMNLLRDKSASIQFEAFHVFKVFVANPKKPAHVTQILYTNREKLIAYLQKFQNDKEDEQFMEEKALLIKTLANLTPEPKSSPTSDQEHQQSAPTTQGDTPELKSASTAPPPSPSPSQ